MGYLMLIIMIVCVMLLIYLMATRRKSKETKDDNALFVHRWYTDGVMICTSRAILMHEMVMIKNKFKEVGAHTHYITREDGVLIYYKVKKVDY